jgi:hypothetical protein
MKVQLIQYSNHVEKKLSPKEEARKNTFETTIKNREINIPNVDCGIDEVVTYDSSILNKNNFYQKNKDILDTPEGAGLWAWKPFVVIDALKNLDDNDILFYYDANWDSFNKTNVSRLVDYVVKNDYLFHQSGYGPDREWTKRDVFIWLDCDEEKYWDTEQIQATWFFLKNTKANRDFVEKWLLFCCIKQFLDHSQTGLYEPLKGFHRHSWDQSILSLLCKKNNMKSFLGAGTPTSQNKRISVFMEYFNYDQS